MRVPQDERRASLMRLAQLVQLLQHALTHARAPGRRHRKPHLLLDDRRRQNRRGELYAIHVIRDRRRGQLGLAKAHLDL